MKVIIAGGGVAGLTAAVALAQHNIEVRVFEQAERFGDAGGGIQISPNGTRVLHKLGIMPYLVRDAFFPEGIEIRTGKSNTTVMFQPLRDTAERRWGMPYMHIHRADLIRALVHALADIQPDALCFGAVVAGYETESGRANVILSDGQQHSCDVLIAADGIKSGIRQQMLGSNDMPVFSGKIAWRAQVPASDLGDLTPPPSSCVWIGQGKHAVTTRVHAGATVNWVGVVDGTDPASDSWDQASARADAARSFADWSDSINKIIDVAPVVFRTGLYVHKQLPQWSDGPVTLIGDAAHPMLPSLAQGAVQAMEDAYVLIRNLVHATTNNEAMEDACKRYFQQRIKRTSRIQTRSQRSMRLFHTGGLVGEQFGISALRAGLALMTGKGLRAYDWLYGHDCETDQIVVHGDE